MTRTTSGYERRTGSAIAKKEHQPLLSLMICHDEKPERAKQTPSRSDARWSDLEVSVLRKMCAEGAMYHDIGLKIGRSRDSVYVKAQKLGLSNGRPRGGGRITTNRRSTIFGDRAMEIGTAAEHIVCAHLLISGYRAFQSSAGLPYDVVAEVPGGIIRIAVKSSSKATARPAREGGRVCYQFAVARPGHKKRTSRRYTISDCDLVALVAVDVMRVAYFAPVSGTWMTCTFIDPPGVSFECSGRRFSRKRWDDYPLEKALREMGRLPND